MRWLAAAIALGVQVPLPALTPQPDVHLAAGVLAARALERPTAGIVMAVDRRGALVVLRAFGMADLDRKSPATTNSIFRIGSVSEYIETALVLRMVDEGRLALEQDILTYVPDALTQQRRVTLRHLLTHTSGLPDVGGGADRPFEFEPGTAWRESTADFVLVRAAVERVSGQPYRAVIRETLFAPLQMFSSSFCGARETITDAASGYDVAGGQLVLTPTANGGVCTTARDLATFERALGSARIISRASLGAMRSRTALSDGTSIDYGLGTQIGALQGHAVVGHAGTADGFSAAILSFPDDRLSVVVLSNTSNDAATPLAAAIARSSFEMAPARLDNLAVPAADLDALAGTFRSSQEEIRITACGPKLCLEEPAGSAPRALLRQEPRVYAVDADRMIRFDNVRAPQWAFVYSGGLMIDARRRVRSR